MLRFLIHTFQLLSLILMVTLVSCDDEKLESSTVTFSGSITDVNYVPLASTKFEIQVRTNPNNDPDTTVMVRIPAITDEYGNYDVTVHTDGFPAIPYYTIAPATDTLMTIETATCLTVPRHQQVLLKQANVMNARFGAATFLKITFHRIQESTSTGIRMGMCHLQIATTIEQPDVTFTLKFAYDSTPSQYTISYVVLFGDFFAETRQAEVTLYPYETTSIVIDY